MSTVATTVISGVSIFILGQIIIRFILDPLMEFRRVQGEIASSLTFYAAVGGEAMEEYYLRGLKTAEDSDASHKAIIIERYKDLLRKHWSKSDDAQLTLRRQASELLSKASAIPGYKLLSFLKVVPSMENIIDASAQLIGMSNSVHRGENFGERIEKITSLLQITALSKKYDVGNSE